MRSEQGSSLGACSVRPPSFTHDDVQRATEGVRTVGGSCDGASRYRSVIGPLSLRSVLADCSRLRLWAMAQEESRRSAVLQDYV